MKEEVSEEIGISNIQDYKSPNEISFIAYYPENYCGSCIDLDLPYVKNLHKKYPSYVYVNNKDLEYNISTIINVEGVQELNYNLKKEDLRTPLFLVVDKSGEIILQHLSHFSKMNESKKFFKKADFMLSLVAVE